MNGLNLDPGLRQAFAQQTHQRLLTEANQARLVKCTLAEEANVSENNTFTLRMKLRIIAQIVQEAGSTIVNVLNANGDSSKV
jgi:hypothetical protein